jgi:tRNA threonylcarbamoyl adenosine modification protein YeaZ
MVSAMNLLAIDTALEACSVAVAAAGRPPVLRSEIIGRGHAERLFGMLSSAMAEAGLAFPALGRIAVTIGPGSFTGIRVGIAAARGLALVVGCPVVGIGTLPLVAAAARGAGGARPVLAVLDAKRDEVYAQAFDPDGVPLSAPCAVAPAAAAALVRPGMALAGSGAALVAAAMPAPAEVVAVPPVPDIAVLLGLAAAAPEPEGPPRPLYLRAPDAKPQAQGVARR